MLKLFSKIYVICALYFKGLSLPFFLLRYLKKECHMGGNGNSLKWWKMGSHFKLLITNIRSLAVIKSLVFFFQHNGDHLKVFSAYKHFDILPYLPIPSVCQIKRKTNFIPTYWMKKWNLGGAKPLAHRHVAHNGWAEAYTGLFDSESSALCPSVTLPRRRAELFWKPEAQKLQTHKKW